MQKFRSDVVTVWAVDYLLVLNFYDKICMYVDVGTFTFLRNCYKVKYFPYFVVNGNCQVWWFWCLPYRKVSTKAIRLGNFRFFVHVCPVIYSIYWPNSEYTFWQAGIQLDLYNSFLKLILWSIDWTWRVCRWEWAVLVGCTRNTRQYYCPNSIWSHVDGKRSVLAYIGLQCVSRYTATSLI